VAGNLKRDPRFEASTVNEGTHNSNRLIFTGNLAGNQGCYVIHNEGFEGIAWLLIDW
jgi:hypothetical protein